MNPADRFTDPTVRRFIERFGRLSAYEPGARARLFIIVSISAAIGSYLAWPLITGDRSISGGAGLLPAYPSAGIKWALAAAAAATFIWGRCAARVCAGLLILGYFIAWGDLKKTVVVLVFLLSAVYVAVVLFRVVSALAGRLLSGEMRITPDQLRALTPADLKPYTVLVPLYREPEVAAVLVRALENIDYPTEKLDIKLLLEADDSVTREALAGIALPGYVSIVVAPDDPASPKCKPRACNHGLHNATGEYLVIYDAEDRPEPDQLKKAAAAFKQLETDDPSVICLQAKLNYFNRSHNLLTELFTIEYSTWFDLFLPGLHAMRAPIPLGGTSNHFKVRELKAIGGWDPFNVTEDCDLGLRIHRRRFKTRILDSTTWEEANSRVGNWIRQRSRWIKGYLQTHLAHTRSMAGYLFGDRLRRGEPVASDSPRDRGMGLYGGATGWLTVGGLTFFMLLNPIFWLASGAYLERQAIASLFEPDAVFGDWSRAPQTRRFLAEDWKLVHYDSKTIPERRISVWRDPPDALSDHDEWAYASQIFYPFVVGLAAANVLIVLLSVWACVRRRYWSLLPTALIIPFYWALISLAAWKGALQLLTRPFHWEKTVHGLSGDAHTGSAAWLPERAPQIGRASCRERV